MTARELCRRATLSKQLAANTTPKIYVLDLRNSVRSQPEVSIGNTFEVAIGTAVWQRLCLDHLVFLADLLALNVTKKVDFLLT